jgi:hypothetical protein
MTGAIVSEKILTSFFHLQKDQQILKEVVNALLTN